MIPQLNTPQETEAEPPIDATGGYRSLKVDRFTDGFLDSARPMLGPVCDGGEIVAHTAPGCWGPMLTPCLRGNNKVTIPVTVAGAEIGDARFSWRENRKNKPDP